MSKIDRVLINIGHKLKSICPPSDVVCQNAMIGDLQKKLRELEEARKQ